MGRYLTDDFHVAQVLRAKKAQAEREELKRLHEAEMNIKRSKREADRQAEAERVKSQLVVGTENNGCGGSPLKTATARENDGRGFGKYLNR